MVVIFPVRDRIELLPYFLKYYAAMGATRFVCGLYLGEKSPLYKRIQVFRREYDLAILSTGEISPEKFNAPAEAQGLNKIRQAQVGPREWYAIADLDEFHYFDGHTLPEVARAAETKGYAAVGGVFRDRIGPGGTFPKIRGRLDDAFPLACLLTKEAGLSRWKIVLARGRVRITPGHHKCAGRVWRRAAHVHHFKWSEGVYERSAQMHQRYTRQNLRWAITTMPKLLKLIENGVDVSDPRLEVKPAVRLGI